MKKLMALLATLSLLSTPVFAQQHNSQHQGHDGQKGMMAHGQMGKIQEQMEKMHATMKNIKAEKDPQKRQQLMQEHMAAMEKGMGMMINMHKGKMQGPGQHRSDGDQHMKMMEQHMQIMQDMMVQMQEHSEMIGETEKN